MAKEPNWSKEDNLLLKEHYELDTEENLQRLFPTRTWVGIKEHAKSKFKIKRLVSNRVRVGNTATLLEETLEAYYWMGFLLADGTFDKNGRLSLTLSEKDKDQAYKFASFIEMKKENVRAYTRKTNYSSSSTHYQVSSMVGYYGQQIREKFDLKLNKTENPPDLSKILNNTTKDNFLALIIGFIDGDGSIIYSNKKVNTNIKIEIHSSWLLNLSLIEKVIYSYFLEVGPNSSKINRNGYASLYISRTSIVKKLKEFSKNLPRLERKWQKIT
jgi:hypothetical protein